MSVEISDTFTGNLPAPRTTRAAAERAEQLRLRVAADALIEAWDWACGRYWTRRAEQLEWAMSRSGDLLGNDVTGADVARRDRELAEMAAACRARATGADGWARQALADTVQDLGRGAAA